MCSRAPRTAKQRHARCIVEKTCKPLDIRFAWPQYGCSGHDPFRNICFDLHERYVTGQDDNCYTPLRHGDADSAPEDLRKLLGARDKLHIMTAILEQTFQMGGLKIVDPALTARHV